MPAQNVTRKIDPARALAMYDDGATDGEIAATCGVSPRGICQWRYRDGLMRTAHNDDRLTETQVRRAKNMLRDGATRAQVAAHIGVSGFAVQAIRRKADEPGLRWNGVSGTSVRNAVLADEALPRRIEQAIGMRVPRDIRMEAVNELYLDLLDGGCPSTRSRRQRHATAQGGVVKGTAQYELEANLPAPERWL